MGSLCSHVTIPGLSTHLVQIIYLCAPLSLSEPGVVVHLPVGALSPTDDRAAGKSEEVEDLGSAERIS